MFCLGKHRSIIKKVKTLLLNNSFVQLCVSFVDLHYLRSADAHRNPYPPHPFPRLRPHWLALAPETRAVPLQEQLGDFQHAEQITSLDQGCSTREMMESSAEKEAHCLLCLMGKAWVGAPHPAFLQPATWSWPFWPAPQPAAPNHGLLDH